MTAATYADGHPPILVRSYVGNEARRMAAFQKEAEHMAQGGYYPVAQTYVPGSWGAGAYLLGLAAILLFGFGLLILGYLIIVKPAGRITVTYQRR